MNAKQSETKRQTTLIYPEESYLIQGSYYAVYKKFRNTQKETVYQKSLFVELIQKGLSVDRKNSYLFII